MARPPQATEPCFEPCASTASLFLYAQCSAILCLHHDTLAVERRFHSHHENIDFISVDNVSERGAGRLVVSYDVGQTAIVWDIFTGTEIARFASFEHLRVASWMRNGSVAFGNGKGEVILFEPSTSEHISTRTIFDPITSLAPATDCKTYAIGYQNGSILIATLLPQFTILHTLTTSRGPSPIVSLAWHASSSKQKSDMLATQSSNGDLRVWSVAKPPGKESPRVIRVLKRPDSTSAEPKWIGWSKNGKIVQYLDGETWAWDVRTKHVTYEAIPTIENVRGLSNYGPTATLFTIGPDNSVQQYDLDVPSMVANVQHLPLGTPSLASEENRSRRISPRRLQDAPDIREQVNGRRTPSNSNGVDSMRQRADMTSPAFSRSGTESVSSKASSEKYRPGHFSPRSRSGQSGTSFSLTSAGGGDTPQPSASYAYASSVSMSSVKSSRAGSRLRNEVHLSPAERNIVDLFPFTRARLNDVPYKHQPPLDETNLTPDDLRQQMLNVVFGWEGDIKDLIRDELSRHAVGSQSAILLAQWLEDTDTDQMASMISPGQVTTSDWMVLALSQMRGQAQANRVGQAFVQKLLEIGDIHTSATILLGLGDSNDAIEVYVSRNHFMEAILMTCLLMPSEWRRQSYLVRRWGEYVVSHSQQQLAIRCFMCTGVEPSDPWTSPSAQQAASFAEIIRERSPLNSPQPPQPSGAGLMPPSERPSSTPNQRPGPKTPALKLITSFDSQPNQRFRFPGLKSDDRTPTNAPGVTPIAESAVADSALSPGGFGSSKLNNIQTLNQAVSRTNTPAFNRGRLSSIGETPVDVHPPTFSRSNSYSQGEYTSTSENEEVSGHKQGRDDIGGDNGLLTLSSARYNPEQESQGPSPQTAVQATDKFAAIKGLPSPAPGVFEALKDHSDCRNGSRDRKPDGLEIELVQAEEEARDMAIRADLIHSARSTSTMNSHNSGKSPMVSGRSIDQYISSLDEANYHAKKNRGHRTHGRERRNTDETANQSSRIHHSREPSQETRGRNDRRYIKPAKRSPSSPVPMSPEEVARYNNENTKDSQKSKPHSRTRSGSKVKKSGSRTRTPSERRHNRSSSRNAANHLGGDKRDPSARGRSIDRDGCSARSPSSPLPMTLPADEEGSRRDDVDDRLRLVASDRERRSHHRNRSASQRRAERDVDVRRDQSSEETKHKATHSLDSNTPALPLEPELLTNKVFDTAAYSQSQARPRPDSDVPAPDPEPELLSNKVFGQENVFANGYSQRKSDPSADEAVSPTTPFVSLAEKKRRELAAAELEARRLSLARNPSAPNIPFPGELQSARIPVESPPPFHGNSYYPRAPSRNMIPQSKASPEYPSSSDSSSPRSGNPIGLPATPRAMRHPRYSNEERAPSVPSIPTDSAVLLANTRYQGDAERIERSMSVPTIDNQTNNGAAPVPSDLPMHPRFNPNLPRSRSSSRTRNMGHRRTSSGGYASGTSPNVTVSIEETIENAMQKEGPSAPQHYETNPPPPAPPILPELQHLNTPPPPPPAPRRDSINSLRESSATIDVAIDNADMGKLLPRAMTAAPALNGNESRNSQGKRISFDHRRNRSSNSNESFANKLRSLARMRGNSRSVEPWASHNDSEVPYESVHSHSMVPGQG